MDMEFTDDSSAALGLGHNSSGLRRLAEAEELDRKRIERELRDRGITDTQLVVPRNQGAYDGLSDRVESLQAAGMSYADATDQALQESRADALPEPKEDYMGDSTHNLMKHVGTISHGGGSKGRKREKKRPRGTPFRTIEDEPRNVKVSARITESTEISLDQIEEETGINTAGLLAAIGLMWESDKNSVKAGLVALKALVPVTSAMKHKKAS